MVATHHLVTAITTRPGSVSSVKKLALLAPVAALVLAGCAHDPTTAARVGDQSIPVSDISVMANYLCASAAQGQQVVPMAQVNEIAVTYLVGAKALADLAARHHVSIPTSSSPADSLVGKLPSSQRARAVQLVDEVNGAAGFFAQRGASNSQQILSAFASLIQAEAKAGRFTGNPAYPTVTDESAGSLSRAVSSAAQDATSVQPSTGYLAALPSGQKCG